MSVSPGADTMPQLGVAGSTTSRVVCFNCLWQDTDEVQEDVKDDNDDDDNDETEFKVLLV